jgi:signal transduction histidine kinase
MTRRSASSVRLTHRWAATAAVSVARRLDRSNKPGVLKPADAARARAACAAQPSCLPWGDELLATTAHELRLPLAHMAEIDLETDRLTHLVERLLEAAVPIRTPTAPGPAERTLVGPAALVEGGLHRVRGLLGDHTVEVDLPRWLPSVRVDVDAIERVLANLLQNAARYSPPHGRIAISAWLASFEAIEIAVDDEGPGIPEDERPHVFERFFRGRATRSTLGGHGLGLAICQAIVLAHGGDIRVDDAPGGGARFRVRLPVQLASR